MNIKQFLKPSKKKLLIVVLLIVIIFIFKYNDFFGHSCNNDSDCKFICGAGAVNNRFIYFSIPFLGIRDCWPAIGICENKKCQVLSPYIATSIENCEKIQQKKPQWVEECYYFLAGQLNDISLCDKVDNIFRREQCIKGIK